MKKFLCSVLAIIMAFSVCTVAYASSNSPEADELNKKFVDGVGPEVEGIAIDYASYEPQNTQADTKYPLVILLHGMGQGTEKRKQLEDNNFSLFASDAMQARFTNGAAYIFVPRSDESNDPTGTWSNDEVNPLYAAIYEYIEKYSDTIDLSRIYIGGYSMGGKMTLKMLSAYPDMFAAAFPMCPAYLPTDEQMEEVKDIPMWIICSKYDLLAGYYVYGRDIWEKECKTTTVADDCRISIMGKVCYADGKKTTSNHHVWFAVCNDMFSSENGDYPNTITYDGNNKEIKLEYPKGLVSWLCQFTSGYNGEFYEPTELVDANDFGVFDMAGKMIKSIGLMLKDTLTSLFTR